MITAAIVESHRFGRVWRNGYDPAEVDAVVGRLADKLERAEQRIVDLEHKLDDADVSANAIRSTLAAVEVTKAQLLEDAEHQATGIRDQAAAEASEVMELAENLGREVSARRDAILIETFAEADEIVSNAESESAARATDRARLVSHMMDDAVDAVSDSEREASQIRASAGMASAWTIAQATTQASKIVADAETEAMLIISRAEGEGVRLDARMNGLRKAVATLEVAAHELANIVLAETDTVDLNAIEAEEARQKNLPAIPQGTLKPVPDHTDTPEEDQGPVTYYQRRTMGLKERIKIARSME